MPGHHCFTDRAPIAPGTAAAELPALAALALERGSPFPDEQLARGYFAAPGAGMLVFAALRRKFLADQDAWKAAAFVVPDFATWLPRGKAQPAVVVLETSVCVTALDYGDDSVLPRAVVSRPVPAEPEGPEAIALAREQALARVVPGGRRVWRYRLGQAPSSPDGTRLTVDWQPVDGAPAAASDAATLTATQLWAMDLRETEFLRLRQRDFRWNRIAWTAVLAIGAIAALLLLGELALVGGNLAQNGRLARIEAQAPAARKAETNSDLAGRLAAYLDRKPQPLDMLRYINERRPASISFRNATIEGASRLVAEGMTNNPGDISEFVAVLKGAPGLSSAEVTNNPIRDGRSTFQLTVVFRPGFRPPPLAQPEAPAAAPVPAQPAAPQSVPVQP